VTSDLSGYESPDSEDKLRMQRRQAETHIAITNVESTPVGMTLAVQAVDKVLGFLGALAACTNS